MSAQAARDAIAALDQEIETLQYIIDRMSPDEVIHGENWREILVTERGRRIQDREAWLLRLKSLRQDA